MYFHVVFSYSFVGREVVYCEDFDIYQFRDPFETFSVYSVSYLQYLQYHPSSLSLSVIFISSSLPLCHSHSHPYSAEILLICMYKDIYLLR